MSLAAAVTCDGAWAAKAVVIWIAGGLGRSPLEGPLFLLGVAAFVVAVVSLALALSAGRGPAVRAVAVLGGVAAGAGLVLLAGALVGAVQPADPSWVWGEVNLWITGAVLLVAVLWLGRREEGRLS